MSSPFEWAARSKKVRGFVYIHSSVDYIMISTYVLLIATTSVVVCTGQIGLWQAVWVYALPDCAGSAAQFSLSDSLFPAACRNTGCEPFGIGSAFRACYNSSDLMSRFPSDMTCPGCSYCKNLFYPDTTCTSSPKGGGLLMINACHPSTGGGYYYIMEGCTEDGIETWSKAYSDNRCTVPLFTNPSTPGRACVESSPFCTERPTDSKLSSCHYAMGTRSPSGNTTNNQTSSGTRPVFGFIGVGTLGASLFLLIILVFVCI